MSMPINASIDVIRYWLEEKALSRDEFTKRAIRVISLKFKDRGDELQYFMEAIDRKEAGSLCSFVDIRDYSKRLEVTVNSSRLSIYAPEMVYKVFRNNRATKRKLIQSCPSRGGDTICVNPFHYQLVDGNEANVPDQISDSDRRPQGAVNALRSTQARSTSLSPDEGARALSPDEGARALSPSVVNSKCWYCAEKDILLQSKDQQLALKNQQIAELKKQLESRNASVNVNKNKPPPRSGRRK